MWCDFNNLERLWQEDDACRAAGDESREMLPQAWRRLFNEDVPSLDTALETFDGGDSMLFLFSAGRVVFSSYDGYGIYRVRDNKVSMKSKNDLLEHIPPKMLVLFGSLLSGNNSTKAIREAKKKLGPGVHHVMGSLSCEGVLSIGADVEYTPTAEIPVTAILALLIHRMGKFEKAAMRRYLVELMQEAATLGGDTESSEVSAEYVEQFTEVLSEVKQMLRESLPKKDKPGNTHIKDISITIASS